MKFLQDNPAIALEIETELRNRLLLQATHKPTAAVDELMPEPLEMEDDL
jgi:recombination protein RecA